MSSCHTDKCLPAQRIEWKNASWWGEPAQSYGSPHSSQGQGGTHRNRWKIRQNQVLLTVHPCNTGASREFVGSKVKSQGFSATLLLDCTNLADCSIHSVIGGWQRTHHVTEEPPRWDPPTQSYGPHTGSTRSTQGHSTQQLQCAHHLHTSKLNSKCYERILTFVLFWKTF